MKLQLVQKNSLLELIEENGLSPFAFEFFELFDVDRNLTSAIRHKASEFFFEMMEYQNGIYVNYSPGVTYYTEKETVQNWVQVRNLFVRWVVNVKNEITAVDKWERMEREAKQIGLSYENGEDKFSAEEYEDLKKQMLLLREKITAIDFLPDQLKAFENKIDYLTELAVRSNKFDWKSLFIGTFLNIIIQLGVTRENAQAFWDMVKTIFNKYFLSF